jgi:hypothetical protein
MKTAKNLMILSFALLAASLSGLAQPQNAPAKASLRMVHGRTLVSAELPAAELTFGPDFRYVGGQIVNLYGNADAEQHLFVHANSDGLVQRFYWVQFEHFLPTNTHTYNYPADHTVDLGGLGFTYDIKSWPDYAALQIEDPASDGATLARMLSQQHLAFPKAAVRVRMFYLPTPDHRTELMIIYGQALPETSDIPARKDGVDLSKESPAAAERVLEQMKHDLVIRITIQAGAK